MGSCDGTGVRVLAKYIRYVISFACVWRILYTIFAGWIVGFTISARRWWTVRASSAWAFFSQTTTSNMLAETGLAIQQLKETLSLDDDEVDGVRL